MEFLVPSPVCSSVIITSTLIALILCVNLEYPSLLLRFEVYQLNLK